jgi:hypothetical protein
LNLEEIVDKSPLYQPRHTNQCNRTNYNGSLLVDAAD